MKWLDLWRGLSRSSRAERPQPAAVRSPLALSLEPRMLFDGAVAATAAEVADSASAASDPAAHDTSQQDTQDTLATAGGTADTRREVVFVDGNIQDYQQLLAGLPAGTEVVVLDASRNGLEQMADYLEGRTGIDAIHLLSHGESGAFKAGNAWIDAGDLAGQSETLARIGEALSADGDILLYGCKTGDGASGAALVTELARLTQADVAASSDNTGAARLGGDWVLETQAGDIETLAIAASDFDALLAAPTTLNFDNVDLTADSDGDPERSLGESPRVFDGWTVSLLDSTGSNVTGNSFLDVSANSGDSPIIAGGGDKALFANGEFGIVRFLQFAATDGSEFKLDSFSVSNPGLMAPNLRVIGYRDGAQVATQDFVLSQDGSVLTVTLSGAAWQYIDAFRIVQQDNSSDIQFWIDDVNVSPAILPNVAPVVSNLNGDSAAFIEEAGAVLLDVGGNATLVDSDSADFSGGNITVAITANRVAGEDVLSVRNEGNGAGQVGLSGSVVSYGGVQVGTLTGGTGNTNMVISLNAQATPEAVQAILRNLTYNNTNTTDPSTSTRSIQVSVNDGDGGTSNLSAVTVSVTGVNDGPTASATGGTPTFTENGSAVDLFSGVSIGAVESGQTITGMTLTVTNLADGASEILRIDGTDITLTNGFSTTTATNAMTVTVSLVGGTATVTLSKAGGISGANAQTLVDGITYRNASDTPSTAANRVVTLTSISDSGGTANGGADTTSLSLAATVTVVATDDPSTVSTSGGTTAFTEGSGAVAIDSGLTLSDPDSASLTSATVSITGNFMSGQDVLAFVNDGSTMGNITGSYNAATGVLTLTSAGGSATLAQWQAALRSVTYSNSSDLPNTSNRTVSIVVNDGTSDSNTATKTVSVTSVNDAPVITAPANRTVTEDAASALTGISFSDADAGSSSVTVTFSVGSGTLAATSGGGVTVGGTSSALTLTGSIANINTFIAGSNVTFTTAANATSNVTLTVGINDGGNTGSGGAQTDSKTVTLQVAAVNDAPVINAPASINVNEDVTTVLTGITVTDVDAGTGEIEATVSVSSGTLVLNGDNVGSSLVLVGGNLQDLNDFLASGLLAFRTDSNATGNAVLTIQVEDFGNTGSGGSLTDTATVTLVVTAVNDAPVNSLPPAQSVDQDSVLVFSSGNGNQISISDVDAGSGNVRVTLTATNGLISLGGTTGLSFTAGDGTSDATMTFEGTLADINAALNGMSFSPTGGYNGPASLQITTNDLGLSGSGGNQTDTDTLAITVNTLNPEVTSVNVTNPDGGYKVGDVIQVTVTFDQVVNVDTSGGVPSLLLETGSTDRLATYVSGSGSNTLTFTYTVQAGDISADLDYQSTGALALNGATIRNADNDDAVLTLPALGSADSIAGQHAVIIDGVVPTVASVSVPANGTYVAGQNLDFTVNFSETVIVDTSGGTPRIAVTLDTGGTVFADYVSGSGSSALVFRLTVASGQLDSNGITLGSSIQANGGTLRDAVGNAATTTLNSVGSTSGVLVDAVVPVVASVSVPANGAYNAGDVLTFTVNASESVVVNTAGGTPRLALDIGGVTRYATYVSGSGTGALVFQYSVQAGDTDADGIAISGLETNGGTLRDAAGNSADLTLNSVGSTAGVTIDTTAPTATGLVRVDATPTTADSVRFTLTFSEGVSGVDLGDFSLVTTGTASGVIQSIVQVDAQTFQITVGNLSGDGSLGLNLNGSGTGIVDQAGNGVTAGLTGEVYALDNSAPAVTSVAVPANGTYVAGQNLDFTVNFSETVIVDTSGGTPRIAVTLDTGGTVFADYVSGSGSSALVFRLTVASGQLDSNGITLGSSIQANGGTLRDAVGNAATTTLNSVGSTSGVLVDAVVPVVASVSVPANGAYNAGDVLTFTVNASESVVVNTAGGTPRLALDIGGVTRYATYVSGSGTGALVFQYSVQAGDTDADGIAISGLETNGGTLRDAAGNSADLTLNSVGSTAGVTIDTTAPTATGLVRVDATPTTADSVRFTLTFSEGVSGVDLGDFSLVTTGTASGVIQSIVQVDAQTFQITVGSLSGDGSLGLSLNGSGTGIVDQAGNDVAAGLTGEAYVLDNTGPAVSSVGLPANAVYTQGQVLEFTVAFDDAVTVDTSGGVPRIVIQLDTGGTVYANYVSGSGGNVLTFRYQVDFGQVDQTGISLGSTIDANGASLHDSIGNAANLALGSLPSTAGIQVNAPASPDSGDPEFRIQPSPSPIEVPLVPKPVVPGATMPPPLFEIPTLGSNVPTLGNVFTGGSAIAPSFFAQLFNNDSFGDGGGKGFLGFGGGDAGIFTSSTLSMMFDRDVPQEDSLLRVFDGKQWRGGSDINDGVRGAFGTPSLGQQLQELNDQEQRRITDLAWALGQVGQQA